MDLGFCGSLGKLRHILCKWHLLRALKKNLKSHVPLNMVEDMMTELRVMVNEKDEEVFKKMQSGFIAKYENSSQTKTYIEYYRKNYEVRMQKWAMCFRNFPHANINTTGHIESFHHRLKKVYLKRKVNRRLDDLVNILLDIEWDDHVARVREVTVGTASQPQDILQRHKRAMSLKDEDLKQVDENTWDIKASSGKDIYFIVHYHEKCPSDHCFSKCIQLACSSLCAHMYSCSCKDNHPLCKHVHKLHSFLTRDLVKQVRDNVMCDIDDLPLPEEDIVIVPQMSNDSERRRTLAKSTKELEQNLSRLADFISSNDSNSIAKSNAVAHAAHVTGELVLQLQYMSSEDSEDVDVTPMEPVMKFNANEKLKTQASQVSSFKRPPAKRKGKAQGMSSTKRQAVVKNLLSVLQTSSSVKNFTPPLSFVPDLTDIVLKYRNEKISLLNLKSLEYDLPFDEKMKCMKRDPAFHPGWLYSSIINAYLDCLEEQYPSVLSVSSDLAWRASRGRSNSSYLVKKLEDTQKDVILLPANLSGSHWFIIAVRLDLAPTQLWCYDPLQGKLSNAMEILLFQLCEDLKLSFRKSNWDTVVYVEAAKQTDNFNCGAHIFAFAQQMARKSHPYTVCSNINAFRKEIYHTIVGECLSRETFDTEKCLVCCRDFLKDAETDSNTWISCAKCDQWFHVSCVGEIHGSEFVCPLLMNLSL
ncbi:hypothetical protein ONE63_009595 [Megalurothrips usitatus]|uniref:Ubiquitin-like protease family profile domain-containing protein n=1 Tax=Megalurothrips usitatus TaxID=439358 RepID=A0AAV7XPV6_9NEOP|nr:hypothetical protein ONE63_009595 [Megalurothrips usitatus]